MQELVFRRTYTDQRFRRADGQLVTRVHAGHIHYVSAGVFEPVDLRWQDGGTFWVVGAASYRMRVAKDFSAAALIEYQNRYLGMTQTVRFDPRSLVWVDGRDFAGAVTFRTQQPVDAVLASPNVIRYPEAFGAGIHFEITLLRSGFKKEIVIDARVALGAAPSPLHHLALLVRYDDGDLTVGSGAETWDRASLFERASYQIRELSGASIIAAARAEDASAPFPRFREVPVLFAKRQDQLWQIKVLPRLVIEQAVYPLRADTTTQFATSSGDGQANTTALTWDDVHDAVSGGTNHTGSTALAAISLSSGSYGINRAFLPVDTSGLPDTEEISAATLFVKPQNRFSTIGGDNNFCVVVGPTTQTDTSALTALDYDDCAAVDAPTELSDRIAVPDMTTGVYVGFVLNAAGRAQINPTGFSMLGLREGHDVTDTAPVSDGASGVSWYMLERTGTGDDPYLEVVHAPPAARRFILTRPA
jgi:hypothetical protein